MSLLNFITKYLGPLGYMLFPLSILTFSMMLYVLYQKITKTYINEWIEILLCHFREFAVMLGLMGSIYSILHAFAAIDGAGRQQIQNQMFKILSTGLWSTFYGCIVAIIASFGLILLKRV